MFLLIFVFVFVYLFVFVFVDLFVVLTFRKVDFKCTCTTYTSVVQILYLWSTETTRYGAFLIRFFCIYIYICSIHVLSSVPSVNRNHTLWCISDQAGLVLYRKIDRHGPGRGYI